MSAVLQAKERVNGQYSTLKKLRDDGNIPAILNGTNISKPIYIDTIEFIKTIRESGRNGIINLKVENENHPVMLNDFQQDPIKNEILHADFQIVNMKSEVEVEVNVHLVGDSVGVKDGGVIQQSIHQLSIRALPGNIPQSIDIDISNIEVGQTITVGEVNTMAKYELNHEADEVIASILAPRQEVEIDSGEEQEEGIPENVEGREG